MGQYVTTEEFCECPDWHYRRQHTGGRCKHQRALYGEEQEDMSETALVRSEERITPAERAPLTRRLTPEQRALLKRQIGGGKLSDDQLDFALGYCQAKGLDPLGREVAIWLQGDRVVIHLTAEGLLAKAARSARCEGIDGPYWCGPDGVWVEVWLKSEPPAAAKWIAYVKGWRQPRRGIALYKNYYDASKPTWKQMAEHMLSIRALTNLLKTCPFDMDAEDFAEVDVRTGEILDPAAASAPVVAEVVDADGEAEEPLNARRDAELCAALYRQLGGDPGDKRHWAQDANRTLGRAENCKDALSPEEWRLLRREWEAQVDARQRQQAQGEAQDAEEAAELDNDPFADDTGAAQAQEADATADPSAGSQAALLHVQAAEGSDIRAMVR